MNRHREVLLLSLCAVVMIVMASAVPPALADRQHKIAAQSADFVDPVPAAAFIGSSLNYFTGFEPGEGFTLGYIGNNNQPAGCGGVANPCWGVTTNGNRSLTEGHIDTVHPAIGAQHLRLSHDPVLPETQCKWSCFVDARFPRAADLAPRPAAANSVSLEIAISGLGGMNYRIQPQSNSFSCIESSTLFHYTGGIYVLDDVCGSTDLEFQPTGFSWDATGEYQTFTVQTNPCTDQTSYFYGGQLIYDSCASLGISLEQLVIIGDNFPGSHLDVDNVVLSSYEQCPSVCGNGIVEGPNEECDGDFGPDSNCPGRCLAPGQPGECTCAPICTQANPCPVENGANGPYLTSDGYYLYLGGSPSISIDTCGSSFDSLLTIATVASPGTPLASNDNCNAGQFGTGADDSASCYDSVAPFNDSYPSCACLANPNQPILIRVGVINSSCRPVVGHSTTINIRKKSFCEGASIGACCDTNGVDQGCTDNVAAAGCIGADQVWTDQGKCAEVPCNCIPMCAGRECGADGCGGICGNCDDNNSCNGVETCGPDGQCVSGTPPVCNDGNACNGVETCNPASGCRPGTPPQCNDGQYCNGVETCQPASGCVPGIPINCDDSTDCTDDSCDEIADSCVHDDSHCAIPAMSEWGLAILALLLLIAAKAFFGLRRPNPA